MIKRLLGGGLLVLILVYQAQADITSNLVAHWAMDANTGTTLSDSSASGITLTFAADAQAPTWLSPGKIGLAATSYSAASMQYTQAAITTGSPLYMGSSNFTIAAWVKRASINNYHGIVGIWDNVGQPYWYFELAGDNTLKLTMTAAGPLTVTSTSTLTDTTAWHHVAVAAVRGGNATFYLDGAAVGTPSIASLSGDLTGATGRNVAVGNIGDFLSDHSFDGALDEVRVYQGRALNVTEIAELMSFGSALRRRALLLE